MKMTKGTPW